MTLPNLNEEMQEQGYAGLNDLDDWFDRSGIKRSSYYARVFAETEGARWLAVYDENGNRAGRSYEVVTKMMRDVITKSIEDDVSPDKLRQRLVFAADDDVKEMFLNDRGEFDRKSEKAYQEFMLTHLSRDYVRIALTETSFAFNNGQLLQTLHEGGEYVIFTGGGS